MFLFATRFLKWSICLFVSALMLNACQIGAQDKELREYVQQVLARKGSPLEQLSLPKLDNNFMYQKQALRDPFKPFFALRGVGPDTKRPKEELELFTLDSLRVVGVISRNQQEWAIIHSPDDKVHFISMGNHLGQNFGKVVAIHPEGIELVEFILTGPGSWEERHTTMDITEET